MDVNGDGKADLFVGAGLGSTQVNLYSGAQLFGRVPDLTPLTAFFAPAGPSPDGVRLGTTVGLLNNLQAGPVLLTSSGPDDGLTVDSFDARALFDNPGVAPIPVLSLSAFFYNTYFVSVT
jgi:hypothetical protein